MNVTLLSHTQDPLETLYRAYRGSYSREAAADLTPPPPEQLAEYIQRRLDVGHTSPLQFVTFCFSIEGISRACAQQLTRHNVGVNFNMQSQRYVRFDGTVGNVPMVWPPMLSGSEAFWRQEGAQGLAAEEYQRALENGIEAEDARYILPLGTATNLMMQANFAALLHICDERLCTQSQWEIRKLFAQVKNLVEGVEPILGKMLGPKCMPGRAALCNESLKDWQKCPIGAVRPHKTMVEDWTKRWRKNRATLGLVEAE